jgi:hypothetical protein
MWLGDQMRNTKCQDTKDLLMTLSLSTMDDTAPIVVQNIWGAYNALKYRVQ